MTIKKINFTFYIVILRFSFYIFNLFITKPHDTTQTLFGIAVES